MHFAGKTAECGFVVMRFSVCGATVGGEMGDIDGSSNAAGAFCRNISGFVASTIHLMENDLRASRIATCECL